MRLMRTRFILSAVKDPGLPRPRPVAPTLTGTTATYLRNMLLAPPPVLVSISMPSSINTRLPASAWRRK